MIQRACTAAILVLLARRLEGGEFGRYTFYLAILILLDGLTDFGTGAVAVQRSAEDPRRLPPAIAAGRRLRAAMAGLCFLLLAGPALSLPSPRPIRRATCSRVWWGFSLTRQKGECSGLMFMPAQLGQSGGSEEGRGERADSAAPQSPVLARPLTALSDAC